MPIKALLIYLLFSYGQKHQTRRRLITPSFHTDILKEFLMVMNEQSEILIERLKRLTQTEKEIEISKQLALCALDIICG